MKSYYRIVTLFAVVFFLTAGNAFGKNNAMILQGIKSVRVNIASTLEKSGKRSQLQQDVELKLRLAGIKVDANSSQTLVVEVIVETLTPNSSSQVLGNYGTVKISLEEEVFLSRNPRISLTARTWEGNEMVVLHGPPDDFWKRCRDYVRDFTDGFINDYLSVNPK